MNRRTLMASAAFGGMAIGSGPGHADAPRLSARAFGASGDGRTDDTMALQRAMDAALAAGPRSGMLIIEPGTYRITRPLKIAPPPGEPGNIVHVSGISAYGARLISEIRDATPVIEFTSRSITRFILFEGLDIVGNGREGAGIQLECDDSHSSIYNFCLRDVAVQDCGGDGCRMYGNVFEGQVINSYFRKNKQNGMTFSHGARGGILSAIHVMGCVFGDNSRYGVQLTNQCNDVGFHGCYFLLNGSFGMVAENGVTLLSHCGFENNQMNAPDFGKSDAGLWLQNFGTLVSCTGYSIFKQTAMLKAWVLQELTMIGCAGSGNEQAQGADLAHFDGAPTARIVMIGCRGTTRFANGLDAIEIGGVQSGARFGSKWNSHSLAQLGDYRLWIDAKGRLRMKSGRPEADDDGQAVGA